MHPILKNVLGLIAGFAVCMIVNMLMIQIGSAIISPPEGVDPNDIESIKANLHLYSWHHYMVPLFAHALGSFFGALVAVKIVANNKLLFALVVGAFHLAGGIMMYIMLPDGPTWFNVADLGFAYIPMAWLAARIAKS